MAFHFLESRKRQTGADFSRVEILLDPNPRPAGWLSRRKVSLCSILSDLGTMVLPPRRRGPAVARGRTPSLGAPLPELLGWLGSPHLPQLQTESQGLGIRDREEAAPGRSHREKRTQPQVRENGAAGRPRRIRSLSPGPGAGLGRRPLPLASLWEETGPFSPQPGRSPLRGIAGTWPSPACEHPPTQGATLGPGGGEGREAAVARGGRDVRSCDQGASCSCRARRGARGLTWPHRGLRTSWQPGYPQCPAFVSSGPRLQRNQFLFYVNVQRGAHRME